MTRTHVIEFESAALVTVAAFAGIMFAFLGNHNPKIRTTFNLPVVAPLESPTPTAAPTPAPTTFSQVSPDGKKKVSMTVMQHSNTSKTYAFTVSDGDGANSQSLYSINLPLAEYMSIPFNTFSPDDKYLFLEHDTNSGTEAFAFRANGDPMSTDATYYNVTQLYNARNFPNTYETTTGWASETLLIVDTKTPSGDVQSYWFEVPSKAIIPLATQF